MSRRNLFLLAAAVAAGALLGGAWWRNRDEAQLRRAVRHLARRMEKTGPETPMTAALRARDVAGLFTRDTRFELADIPFAPDTRSDLTSAVFQARASLERLSIRIHDVSVNVEPDRTRARMELTATAHARRGGNGERAHRSFTLVWRRESDGWRIAEARDARALRPIPPQGAETIRR